VLTRRVILVVLLAALALVPAALGARVAFGMLTSEETVRESAAPGIGSFISTQRTVVGLRTVNVVDDRRGGLLQGPRSNTVVVETVVALANLRARPLRYSLKQFRLFGPDGRPHAAGAGSSGVLRSYSRTDLRLRFILVRPEGRLRLVYAASKSAPGVVFDATPGRIVKGGTPHGTHRSS
jgi:hypothetical protein